MCRCCNVSALQLAENSVNILQDNNYHNAQIQATAAQLLLQGRMGSQALPEQLGKLSDPAYSRNLRRCTLRGTQALGDERLSCVAQGPEGCLSLLSRSQLG